MSQAPQLNAEQEAALRVLNEKSGNVFVTGDAGTGKSFLIRHFLKGLERKRVPVLASTGAAAVLIGGRTFHSFFGLGLMQGGVERTVQKAVADRRVINRIKRLESFVLDEVSMIPGPALRAAETICCEARKDQRVWGGVRVIAVGDFAQLPPVSRNRNREWAFLDETWEQTDFKPIVLKQVMRTNDTEYTDVLQRIRSGTVDDVVTAFLNRKIDCDAIDTSHTHLFPRRQQAETFCQARLAELPGAATEFATSYSGRSEMIERLKKIAPVSEVLRLKEGAFVMLRVNDPQWRYVNGSVGHVVAIGDDELLIQLRNGRQVEVNRMSFAYLSAEGKELASATNFPVSLAYATTIHKAQGQTLESLVANLSGLWEPGQAYVALSRLESGKGLTLTAWSENSIRVDPDVEYFHRQLDFS